jgi:hypothetical protein
MGVFGSLIPLPHSAKFRKDFRPQACTKNRRHSWVASSVSRPLANGLSAERQQRTGLFRCPIFHFCLYFLRSELKYTT